MRSFAYQMLRGFLAMATGFALCFACIDKNPYGPDAWQIETAYDAETVLLLLNDGKLRIAVNLSANDAEMLADALKFECRNVRGN